ncbi:PilW family protein [Limnothrix sp. PR1529]|uniref:PilW family protein n=1 Tax=Limnothrix sp. PR1529 TaxID=1704291 RepID=UPI00117BBACF|nr:type II secretion system protein [Limnothrix sp. PR1529]
MITLQRVLKRVKRRYQAFQLPHGLAFLGKRKSAIQNRQLDSTQTSGFTLIELLISALIAGLIISGLLGIVVELVSTNRRELARSETMRDMGIAAEFMSNELREAIYVYTGKCLWEGQSSPGQTDYCPGLFGGDGGLEPPKDSLPLIAFWKLDPLPPGCTDPACKTYQLSGRTYTLVVYLLDKSNEKKLWDGRARISRLVLKRFNEEPDPKPNTFNDPLDAGLGLTLQTWPKTAEGNTPPDSTNLKFDPPQVLVDFVDDTQDQNLSAERECPAQYEVTPSLESLTGDFEGVRSVYACVLDETGAVSLQQLQKNEGNQNQKVILAVRGNPEGRYGLDRRSCSQDDPAAGEKNLSTELGKETQQTTCRLAAVKTEVLNRGTVNKVPSKLLQ